MAANTKTLIGIVICTVLICATAITIAWKITQDNGSSDPCSTGTRAEQLDCRF